MSRILECCDGAEFGDLVFWDVVNGVISAQDQVGSGEYSYKVGAGCSCNKDLPAAMAEFWQRFRFRITSMETGQMVTIWRVYYSTDQLLSLKYNLVTAQLEAWLGPASGESRLLVCNGVSLFEDTWYLVEVHGKIHDTLGQVDVRVDSVAAGSFTGNTRYFPAIGSINCLGWVCGLSNTVFWIDDLALDNAAWCGEGRYLLLRADGNGDVSQFTGSDGNSVDNYLLVDEVPPDGDTTYIEDSTTGHQDMVTVEDFDGTGREILRAWCEVRARGTAPTGEQLKLGVKTHGTVYVSAAVDLLETYRRRVGDDLAVNPYTSSAWTDGDLDAVQAVVEIP